MKKFLSLLLSVVMMFTLSIPAFAASNDSSKIVSIESDSELYSYAARTFPQHLHALLETGDLPGSASNYTLGQSFSIFNTEAQTNSTCFPVLYNGEIVAIFEVSATSSEYQSSLSVSFAKELSAFLTSGQMKNFVLITDGVHLHAYDGNKSVEIFQLYPDGEIFTPSNLNYISSLFSRTQVTTTTYTNLTTSQSQLALRGPVEPKEYKTVDVKGVSQGSHPWCWAATCAALINYYEGENLSAKDVAEYVFPKDPEQGGNWDDMEKAYNHWGLYPTESSGTVSFSTIKSNINDDYPMHIRLKAGIFGQLGHSVGLIGYEDWTGVPGEGSRIIILLEPNGGVHKSVNLNSSGNFSYNLGGDSYSWSRTITF